MRRIGRQPGEGGVQLEVVGGCGGLESVGLGLEPLLVSVQVDQVQAVLHEPQAELVAHDRRPVLRQRPALDREAGVDAQLDPHRAQSSRRATAAAASSRQAAKRSS